VANVDRSHRYGARNRPKQFREDEYRGHDVSSSGRSMVRDAPSNANVQKESMRLRYPNGIEESMDSARQPSLMN